MTQRGRLTFHVLHPLRSRFLGPLDVRGRENLPVRVLPTRSSCILKDPSLTVVLNEFPVHSCRVVQRRRCVPAGNTRDHGRLVVLHQEQYNVQIALKNKFYLLFFWAYSPCLDQIQFPSTDRSPCSCSSAQRRAPHLPPELLAHVDEEEQGITCHLADMSPFSKEHC